MDLKSADIYFQEDFLRWMDLDHFFAYDIMLVNGKILGIQTSFFK